MAKPKGSKEVICRCKKSNFILPGATKKCSGKKCVRMLSCPKTAKSKRK